MKIKKELLYLVLITILAGILRFYKLNSYPSLTVDAAAVGYNAYSIIKTSKDEFGVKFPVFFKSFGEGKLPFYVYEAIIPVAIFGLNLFSARFMASFLGTLTVFILYFWIKEILIFCKGKNLKITKWLGLASSFFLATMPWHIQFSREIFGQESLFWVLAGCYFSIKFLNERKNKYWIYSLLLFSSGLATYHAAKAFVPLWIIYILLIVWKKENFVKAFKLGLLAIILTGTIWLWMSSSKLGGARAGDVSAFSEKGGVASQIWQAQIISQGQPALYTRFLHNKIEAYTRDILTRYFDHFSPSFLFFKGNIEREKTSIPYSGMLIWGTLPIFVIGFYFTIKNKLWPLLSFILIAPLVSALTFGEVNAVRSIYVTAGLAVILGLGLIELARKIELIKNKYFKYLLSGFIIIFFIQNFLTYLNSYYVHQNYFFAKDWQYETREIVADITEIQNNYDEIVVTANMGGNPYIYFLFYNQYDPAKWQLQANDNIEPDEGTSFIHIRKLDNIRFISQPCVTSQEFKDNTLYLCKAGSQTGEMELIKTYYWPNGEESFVMGIKKS